MRVTRTVTALLGGGALAAVAAGPGAGLAVTGTGGQRVRAAAAAQAAVVRIRPAWTHVGRADASGPPSARFCQRHYNITCYQPRQLQAAYHLGPLLRNHIDGRGQTIVIVDSFGSPTVRHDLSVFDKQAGLPDPPSLAIAQPAGNVPPYKPTTTREGWAGETDLDVEYAHVMAPRAKILLVETPTSENEGTTGFPQIVRAEKWVVDNHKGAVISQSFSATEQTFPSRQALSGLRGAYTDAARRGVTVLAASGDSGAADVRFNGSTYYQRAVTSWPDSDPLVTGVGGTQLSLRDGNWTSAVWNDTYSKRTNQFIFGDSGPNPLASGGGKSVVFSRPGYQAGVAGVVGGVRGVPDISMSAACNGAADMYQSFPGQAAGWYPTCGTSEATPLFAGVVALAAQEAGHPLGLLNPRLYALAPHGRGSGIVDVTAGNNTVSFRQDGKTHRVQGFPARRGYDLASGLGTVNAGLLVPRLAKGAG